MNKRISPEEARSIVARALETGLASKPQPELIQSVRAEVAKRPRHERPVVKMEKVSISSFLSWESFQWLKAEAKARNVSMNVVIENLIEEKRK